LNISEKKGCGRKTRAALEEKQAGLPRHRYLRDGRNEHF